MRSIFESVRGALTNIVLIALLLVSPRCFAGETLLSGFEGDLSSSLGIDWQNSANSFAYVSTGATQGTQALSLTTPRTQSVPLRLIGGLDTIYEAFNENTQLRADFTIASTANFREAFFRLQINGGAITIDGADMILTPGETVTGVWDYEAEGVFETLGSIGEITAFSLQLGMRGSDIGLPPTSTTIVDNIRWFSSSTPGDFNNDTVVDAADYTIWRDNLGSGTALPNDTGLGTPIGNAHYELWSSNFSSGGSGSAGHLGVLHSVPEPACILLALSLAILSQVFRRVRR